MNVSVGAQQVIVVDGPSPDVRLTLWPLRDEPWPTWAILAAALAGSVAAGVFAGTFWIGLASVIALAAALWRLWLPVEIRLYEIGVTQTCFRRTWRTPWRDWVGYRVLHRGILLLPDESESAFSRLSALYIPWGKSKDDLLMAVRHYLPEDPPSPSGRG